ncbi:MAG: tyrosine protein phosphatase [Firmicutes bacterium]|nr:tyrosine protein phosphatase [Bacillota bacterium]
MQGYIDIHNHILPGLDDGPVTIQEAVEMACVAHQNNITRIIATPHHNEYHRPTKQEILASFELLQAALRKEAVPVQLYTGHELRISLDLLGELKADEVLPLAGSKYILLEFPFEGIPLFAEDVIFRLRLDGWIPVLAHVERIHDFQRKPERLKKYIDMGCLTQINSNSLTGELGRASLDTARKLLKVGQVDIMASDAHAAYKRPPDFTGALKVATKIIGPERAQALVHDNPAKILL